MLNIPTKIFPKSGSWKQRHYPKPGSAEYDEHIQEEIEHFCKLFEESSARETLFYSVPPSWAEVEVRASAMIQAATGNDLNGHVVTRLNSRAGLRMLSLGAGSGGVEITLAQQARPAHIVCMDINPELLELGGQRASELGLNAIFRQADLNTVKLPQEEFDLVFCHASLHHVIELERLAEQIRQTLRPGGELIIVDVITRSGYLMWPETREVAKKLWQTLPEKFRLNHTAYAEPRIDEQIWEADTSEHGMECIRSEDILPTLSQIFTVECFVPYFSLSRRFFDTMYGPNYDLNAPLDKAILNWIWELDVHYLSTERLHPETFFGIYRKRT